MYVYDALNRLTHKGYPDSTGVDYVYDLVGKIQQVNDPTGPYAFAYDNMGRLLGTTTSYRFLTGRSFTNAYTSYEQHPPAFPLRAQPGLPHLDLFRRQAEDRQQDADGVRQDPRRSRSPADGA